MLKETTQLVNLLPYSLREGARGYLDYVNDVLYSVSLEEDFYRKRNEIQYQIEIVFFLRFLYALLNSGYGNFGDVITFIESGGGSGFSIGSSTFGRETPVVLRWQRVIQDLALLIAENIPQQEFRDYVRNENSVESIIRRIADINQIQDDQNG